MSGYQYKARDAVGTIVRGVLDAEDEPHVRTRLREQGLFVTSLRPRPRRGASWLRARPNAEEVASFTFHLAGLAASGIPLLRGLEVLGEQVESGGMRDAVADISEAIGAGHSLSAALAHHPSIFSPLYLGIVRTGEVAGTIDQALLRLTDYLDREVTMQQRVRTLMVYPIFVLVVATAVAGVFMVSVVPVFERVYRSAGASLPLPTLVLLAASRLVRRGWPLVAVFAGAGIWALRRARVAARVRTMGQALVYRLPRVGAVARTIQAARFVRTFAAMQASGVPVLSALEVTAEVTTDPGMREAIGRIKESVSRGRRLSDAMREQRLIPTVVHRLVAMGEEMGQLDAMLRRAADLLERETDYAIRRLVVLAEPALTLVLGAVVGFLLLALYLPIFGLPKALLR